jgi:hypothetical protein
MTHIEFTERQKEALNSMSRGAEKYIPIIIGYMACGWSISTKEILSQYEDYYSDGDEGPLNDAIGFVKLLLPDEQMMEVGQ